MGFVKKHLSFGTKKSRAQTAPPANTVNPMIQSLDLAPASNTLAAASPPAAAPQRLGSPPAAAAPPRQPPANIAAAIAASRGGAKPPPGMPPAMQAGGPPPPRQGPNGQALQRTPTNTTSQSLAVAQALAKARGGSVAGGMVPGGPSPRASGMPGGIGPSPRFNPQGTFNNQSAAVQAALAKARGQQPGMGGTPPPPPLGAGTGAGISGAGTGLNSAGQQSPTVPRLSLGGASSNQLPSPMGLPPPAQGGFTVQGGRGEGHRAAPPPPNASALERARAAG